MTPGYVSFRGPKLSPLTSAIRALISLEMAAARSDDIEAAAAKVDAEIAKLIEARVSQLTLGGPY